MTVLNRYEWDGVNIAEMYFENTHGPEDAKNFTPMHPYVRKAYKERYGYDPVELCEPG